MRKLIYILITLLIVLTACQPMMHRHHGVSPRTHGHHSEIIGENEAPRENNTPRMHRNHHERMHGSYRSLNDSTGENEIALPPLLEADQIEDRKSTRLNSSHVAISYAVFCLKKKKTR